MNNLKLDLTETVGIVADASATAISLVIETQEINNEPVVESPAEENIEG